MALPRNTLNLVRDLGKTIRGGFDLLPSPSVDTTIAEEASVLANYKREALNLAKKTATERGDGQPPTMTDYFLAAQKVGETHAEKMQEQGIQWTPKVIADLSGQTIDGFQINREHLEPPREALLLASLRAQQGAQTTGTPATLTDTLLELQKIQQSNEKLPTLASLESLRDTMDLDGDHAVSNFFADVDRHAKFEDTIFSNVSFHPAGTLMRNGENGVALTEGAHFQNVTFNGMNTDDTLNLAKGEYDNIHFTEIKGGHIELANGTKVRGMDIAGQSAHFSLGERASIDNIIVDEDTRILSLDMRRHSVISNANFGKSTIAMTSQFEPPATFQNVTMNGNVAGLDFSGLTLRDVKINGKAIAHPSELAEFGISYDNTTLATTRPTNEMAQIRETMQNAIASIGTPVTAAPSPQANIREVAEATPSSITGGENVTLTAALAGGYNQAKDMLAKVQPEAVMSLHNRSQA